MNKRIKRAIKKWEKQKIYLQQKNKINKEKEQLKKKKISTSKILIFLLFINCSVIEIFTGIVTLKSLSLSMIYGSSTDFSPLVALIGAVLSESIGYAIYSLKAAKENTAGGLVYETKMLELENFTTKEGEVDNYDN